MARFLVDYYNPLRDGKKSIPEEFENGWVFIGGDCYPLKRSGKGEFFIEYNGNGSGPGGPPDKYPVQKPTRIPASDYIEIPDGELHPGDKKTLEEKKVFPF